MIILIIVIVVIVIVGGVYMFNSKADTNQTATSGDYDTQTYYTKSKPIKLDVNKQTKIEGKKQTIEQSSSSPASSILGKFLRKEDNTPFDRSNPQQVYTANELIPFYRSSSTPLSESVSVQPPEEQPSGTTPAPAPGQGSKRFEGLSPNEKVFKVFNKIGLEPEICKSGGMTTSNKCKDGSLNLKAWKDAIRRKIFKDEAIVNEIVKDQSDSENLKIKLMTLDDKLNQNKDIPDAVWDKLQGMYETVEKEKVSEIKADVQKINSIITGTASKGGGNKEETTESLAIQINKTTKFIEIKELVKKFFKIMTPDQKKELNKSNYFEVIKTKLELTEEETQYFRLDMELIPQEKVFLLFKKHKKNPEYYLKNTIEEKLFKNIYEDNSIVNAIDRQLSGKTLRNYLQNKSQKGEILENLQIMYREGNGIIIENLKKQIDIIPNFEEFKKLDEQEKVNLNIWIGIIQKQTDFDNLKKLIQEFYDNLSISIKKQIDSKTITNLNIRLNMLSSEQKVFIDYTDFDYNKHNEEINETVNKTISPITKIFLNYIVSLFDNDKIINSHENPIVEFYKVYDLTASLKKDYDIANIFDIKTFNFDLQNLKDFEDFAKNEKEFVLIADVDFNKSKKPQEPHGFYVVRKMINHNIKLIIYDVNGKNNVRDKNLKTFFEGSNIIADSSNECKTTQFHNKIVEDTKMFLEQLGCKKVVRSGGYCFWLSIMLYHLGKKNTDKEKEIDTDHILNILRHRLFDKYETVDKIDQYSPYKNILTNPIAKGNFKEFKKILFNNLSKTDLEMEIINKNKTTKKDFFTYFNKFDIKFENGSISNKQDLDFTIYENVLKTVLFSDIVDLLLNEKSLPKQIKEILGKRSSFITDEEKQSINSNKELIKILEKYFNEGKNYYNEENESSAPSQQQVTATAPAPPSPAPEQELIKNAQTTIQNHLNLLDDFKWNTNFMKKQINDEYLENIIYSIDNKYFKIKEIKNYGDPSLNRAAMEGHTGYQYNLEQMEEPGDKTVVNIPIRS